MNFEEKLAKLDELFGSYKAEWLNEKIFPAEARLQEKDIYAPNDESAFIVEKGNTNTKAGDKIKRDIMLFDSKEEAYAFRQKYLDNSDYVRNYCYLYGGTILDTRKIPLL